MHFEKSPHCVGLLLSLLCIYILNGATVSTVPFTLNIIIKSLIKLYAQAIKKLMDLFPALSLYQTPFEKNIVLHRSIHPHMAAPQTDAPSPGSLEACAYFLPGINIFVQLSVSANGTLV